MTTIYRTAEGMHAVRTWCQARLSAWDHPHHARVVPTTLGSVHVVTAGNGSDVVLLPGTNFAAATWLGLIASLAARHTVHAVDLPGQPGLSASDRPNRAAKRQGSWLADMLSTLGTQRPVLVAHSLGAVAALRAAAAGLATRRLVLVDPAGVMRLKVSMQVMRPTVPWLRKPDPATFEALLTMMMADGHHPGPDLVTWMSLVGQNVRTSLAPSPLPDQILRDLADTRIDVIAGETTSSFPRHASGGPCSVGSRGPTSRSSPGQDTCCPTSDPMSSVACSRPSSRAEAPREWHGRPCRRPGATAVTPGQGPCRAVQPRCGPNGAPPQHPRPVPCARGRSPVASGRACAPNRRRVPRTGHRHGRAGPAPSPSGHRTSIPSWEEFLAGQLDLYFEVNTPSPQGYRQWLKDHVDERVIVPYAREAASRAGLSLEGATKVDAMLISESGPSVVFEAKVLADASTTIKFDVMRNQLARTIDVMLDSHPKLAAPLAVRDPDRTCFVLVTPRIFQRNPHSRLYGRLLNEYRHDPSTLKRDLAHRTDVDWQAGATR